jgi:DNA processing protein
MGWQSSSASQKKEAPKLFLDLTKEELAIVDFIKEAKTIAIDDLQLKLDIPQSKLAMLLLNLEMQSVIIALPGRVYRLN